MKSSIIVFNLGKQKLTQGFIDNLEKTFKNHDLVKINILKSCSRNREEVQEMAEKICRDLKVKMGKDFTYKRIGYTLFIRKWRRQMK